jgi:hypothetical protein
VRGVEEFEEGVRLGGVFEKLAGAVSGVYIKQAGIAVAGASVHHL